MTWWNWNRAPPPDAITIDTSTLVLMVLACVAGCFVGCAAYNTAKAEWRMYTHNQRLAVATRNVVGTVCTLCGAGLVLACLDKHDTSRRDWATLGATFKHLKARVEKRKHEKQRHGHEDRKTGVF